MTTTLTPPSTRSVARHPVDDLSDPVTQSFWLLRIGFTVAPILFGLDKFAHALVDWDVYLAPELTDLLNAEAHTLMYVVGVIEIRSEEHTSELQSLMRISYAVFCLKKKKNTNINKPHIHIL